MTHNPMALNDNEHQHCDFALSLDTSRSLLNLLSYNELMDFARSLTSISTEDEECILPALPKACLEDPTKWRHLDPDEIISNWIPFCPPSPVPDLTECGKARNPSNVVFETGEGVPAHAPRRTSAKNLAVSAKVA